MRMKWGRLTAVTKWRKTRRNAEAGCIKGIQRDGGYLRFLLLPFVFAGRGCSPLYEAAAASEDEGGKHLLGSRLVAQLWNLEPVE